MQISTNFKFLLRKDLAEIATLAEMLYSSHPRASIANSRVFSEVCAKYIAAKSGIYDQVSKFALFDIVNTLKKHSLINNKFISLFEEIRSLGNAGTHPSPQFATNISPDNTFQIDSDTALEHIKKIHKLAVLFHCQFDNGYKDLIPAYKELISENDYQAYNDPVDISSEDQSQKIREVYENYLESSDLDKKLSKVARESRILSKTNEVSQEVYKEILEAGDVLKGRYKIIEELGRGGFGITYKAESLDQLSISVYVVKQFKPTLSNLRIGKASALFFREVEVLKSLKHNNIPVLFDSFKENDQLFLVQEYIDGFTLNNELNIKWQESLVVQLLKDIFSTLAYVHEKEIVHRDIKPENLIRRSTDKEIVVIDFGGVKQNSDDQGSFGTVIGTQSYMSPEQQKGYITFSCDVYAVGIIAIEALSGSRMANSEIFKNIQEWINDLNISQVFKRILLKMTNDDYKNRYANAREALEAIANWDNEATTPPPVIQSPPTSSQVNKSTLSQPTADVPENSVLPMLIGVISGTTVIAALGIVFYSLPYFTKVKLSRSEITIGTLSNPESSQGLADYLENNTVPANYLDFIQGKKIKFRVNGDSTLDYKEAEKRIESKQWDVAFTTSPILSLSAKEQGYTNIAGMFPNSHVYQSALFVKKDSPIQSIKDIGIKTRVALGSFTSASSFYTPVYDLYGKTIIANAGHRGTAILDLVREGKADVGAAAIGDTVRKDDPDFRIIHVSRDIPGAGVYTSPNFSVSESNNLKQLMLIAPQDIRTKANYGDKPESDYTEFKKIVQKVEEILICTDFSINPVILGCADTIKSIEGVVNSASMDGNNFILKFSADNQIYNVTITKEVVKQTIGGDKLTDVQGLTLLIKFDKLGGGNKITVSQAAQIKVKSR